MHAFMTCLLVVWCMFLSSNISHADDWELYRPTAEQLLGQCDSGICKTVYSAGPFHQAMAVLGFMESGRLNANKMYLVDSLLSSQLADGGFGNYGSDVSSYAVTRVVWVALKKLLNDGFIKNLALKDKIQSELDKATLFIESKHGQNRLYTHVDVISDIFWTLYTFKKEGITSYYVYEATAWAHALAAKATHPAISPTIASTGLIMEAMTNARGGIFGSGLLAAKEYRRQEAINDLLSWQDKEGGIVWTAFNTSFSLIAAKLTAIDEEKAGRLENAKKLRQFVGRAADFLESLESKTQTTRNLSWTTASIWDTATILPNLLFITDQQTEVSNTFKNSLLTNIKLSLERLANAQLGDGHFSFSEGGNVKDNDTSSIVLNAFAEFWNHSVMNSVDPTLKNRIKNAIEMTTKALILDQRSDGSWGAFGATNPPQEYLDFFGRPKGGHINSLFNLISIDTSPAYSSMVYDYADPGLTSRVLGALLTAAQSGALEQALATQALSASVKAFDYIAKSSENLPQGGLAWWSRWANGYLANASYIPIQVRRIGIIDPTKFEQTSLLLSKFGVFIDHSQNPDGSFGEETDAGYKTEKAGGNSLVAGDVLQTAYGIMGLIATINPSNVVTRHAQVSKARMWLLNHRTNEGNWHLTRSCCNISFGENQELYETQAQVSNLILSVLKLSEVF